jgi:hypothetical protein
MSEERALDGIRLDGRPLADVIVNQKDTRIIKVRNSEVYVHKKKRGAKLPPFRQHQRMRTKDSKPSKVKYISKKQIEEEVMQKEIKKISDPDLTGAESVYVAFKINDWRAMRSRQIGYSTGKSAASIGALMSTMTKNGMLVREEKEPKKFYYSVSEDCQDLGRIGWGNMHRKFVNETVAKRKKTKKAKSPKKTSTSSTPTWDERKADAVHRAVDKLNTAIRDAMIQGLNVDINILTAEYEGDKKQSPIIDHKVYKEF